MVDPKSCHAITGLFFVIVCSAAGGCRSDRFNKTAQHAGDIDRLPQVVHVNHEDRRQSAGQADQQAVELVVDVPTFVPPQPVLRLAKAVNIDAEAVEGDADLGVIVSQAIANHPEIRRLQASAGEAWARVPQVKALPDPMTQATVYGEPMMMPDGEARGTFMISQSIPSLKRLDAQAQRASFEALMRDQAVRSAEQRITADVREAWYRLYLLGQLLRINQANEQLLQSLVTIATAQVEVGRATAGDVILGTLELSRIEEERLQLRQQLASRTAIFNQLLNRSPETPVTIAGRISDASSDLSLDLLRPLALQQQPEIMLARLQTQATQWGIQIAKLERVPDLTLSYEQMLMRSHPGMSGSDPWQLGAGINIPLWNQKYDAIRQEASQRHFAAHAQTEQIVRANEATLLDLLEQAQAADRTAALYLNTILPQIRQGLDADQRAYGQGTVQFERVIGNARNLLTAEAAYHRAIAEKAIALARLEQAVGAPLPIAEPAVLPVRPEWLPPPNRSASIGYASPIQE